MLCQVEARGRYNKQMADFKTSFSLDVSISKDDARGLKGTSGVFMSFPV